MKKISFLLFCVVLSLSFSLAQEADKVCLNKETYISVKFLDPVNSKTCNIPRAVIVGDVYDEWGEHLLIKAGTVVDIQLNCRRGTLVGDVGRIAVVAISTKAVDGRLIQFDSEPAIFNGNEALFVSRSQVKLKEGTTFQAKTLNDYCFKIVKE